jgi:3',5'-cyclic AMP phosphodiesterase CpdA
VSELRIVQCSDLHFGRDVDLAQVEALIAHVRQVRPTAVVIAGDLTQRARHGEFQAAAMVRDQLASVAPVLAVPGNHDVQWWESPLHVLGTERLYAKYRRDFSPVLTPTLMLPGLLIAGMLSAHGVAWGSLTWNLKRDPAVKGHLPESETDRVRALFEAAPEGTAKVAVLHQNVVRGHISNRWGLAHPLDAQRRIVQTGADLVLCGHDHEEAVSLLDGVVVATSSTHTGRTRGRRPSAFNDITIGIASITVTFQHWQAAERRFAAGEPHTFARRSAMPAGVR